MNQPESFPEAPPAYLDDLNPQQLEAVTASPGPALVLAGAGSGKTRVIVRRIIHLLSQGTPASGVLALTFTNKAAGEMKARLSSALGAALRGLWVGTFHATGARILRAERDLADAPPDFTVMSRGECLTLIKRVMKKEGINPERYPPRDILERIGRMKTARTPGGKEPGGEPFAHSVEAVAGRLAKPYEKILRASGGLDFDDLLALPLRLFRRHPDVLARYHEQFTEILVDEYQDTNAVQNQMVRLMSGINNRVFAVGDDDQSIYRWRGAVVENIHRFETEFQGARIYRLEENYRCSGRILSAAAGVMRQANGRRKKRLFTNNPTGEPVVYFSGADPQVEAQMIFQRMAKAGAGDTYPWGEVAVFYRTNTQSRALEEEARHRKIPYQVVKGQRFYDRTEVQDLSAYLRVVANPDDAAAFTRIINRPSRGLGPAKLYAIAGGEEDSLISLEMARNALAGGLLTGSAGGALEKLTGLIRELSISRLGPSAMLAEIIERTGYRHWLEETSRNSTSLERRLAADRGIEGMGEFAATAIAFEERIKEEEGHDGDEPEVMTRFIEEIVLSSEADGMEDEENRLSMMTLHSAKGLEFRAVAVVGVSDGLIPHGRSIDDPEAMEEERRLLYVGMTRAKEILMLSWAMERRPDSGSGSWEARPSRFLSSLDDDLIPLDAPRPPDSSGERRFGSRRGQGRGLARSLKKEQGESKVPSIALGPFAPGAQVVHSKFGEGRIKSRSGTGDRAIVTIEFKQVGTKKLVLKHAHLSPLSSGPVRDGVDCGETPKV
ncbi:MAG: UvrD-helicase domain-containing protein [Nitrospinota bacterium]|jgi:DNA helicase-2/ATP-dependent DNA helicase PcrA|nr:UvrD-helicase domain-containing protein [Nitrospinota bacterium]